jgi:hypothetical protein
MNELLPKITGSLFKFYFLYIKGNNLYPLYCLNPLTFPYFFNSGFKLNTIFCAANDNTFLYGYYLFLITTDLGRT